MPISKTLPYQWYDTPNLRCATIKDFKLLANKVELDVLQCITLHEGKIIHFLQN